MDAPTKSAYAFIAPDPPPCILPWFFFNSPNYLDNSATHVWRVAMTFVCLWIMQLGQRSDVFELATCWNDFIESPANFLCNQQLHKPPQNIASSPAVSVLVFMVSSHISQMASTLLLFGSVAAEEASPAELVVDLGFPRWVADGEWCAKYFSFGLCLWTTCRSWLENLTFVFFMLPTLVGYVWN